MVVSIPFKIREIELPCMVDTKTAFLLTILYLTTDFAKLGKIMQTWFSHLYAYSLVAKLYGMKLLPINIF